MRRYLLFLSLLIPAVAQGQIPGPIGSTYPKNVIDLKLLQARLKQDSANAAQAARSASLSVTVGGKADTATTWTRQQANARYQSSVPTTNPGNILTLDITKLRGILPSTNAPGYGGVINIAPGSTQAAFNNGVVGLQHMTPMNGASLIGNAGTNVNQPAYLSRAQVRSMVGIDSTNNTPDYLKPISQAQQAALTDRDNAIARRLVYMTSATSFTAQTADRVYWAGSEWVRKTGTVTPNGVTTYTVASNIYYERFLPDGRITLGMAGGSNFIADNSAALAKLIAVHQETNIPMHVNFAGKYLFTSGNITKTQSFTGLTLSAVEGVVFDFSALPANSTFLRIVGGSGYLCQSTISNITFIGNSTSTAVELNSQCGQRLYNCRFGTNALAIRLLNGLVGGHTEYNEAERCTFDGCARILQYTVTTGSNSFHGSGLVGLNWINTPTSPYTLVQIDDGGLPYNTPFSAQIWINGTGTLFNNASTNPSYVPYFVGNLSFERFAGTLTVGTGSYFYYVGPSENFGDYVDWGTCVPATEGVIANKNNSTLGLGVVWPHRYAMTSATYTVPNPLLMGTYWVSLEVEGTNYNYRALYYFDATGGFYGNTGYVTQVANSRNFWQGASNYNYGAPTVSTSNGRLTIANTNYPSSGSDQITLHLYYRQIDNGVSGNRNAKPW